MPVLYINRCDTRIAFWECVVFFKCILTIIHSWKFYMNQGSIKKKIVKESPHIANFATSKGCDNLLFLGSH